MNQWKNQSIDQSIKPVFPRRRGPGRAAAVFPRFFVFRAAESKRPLWESRLGSRRRSKGFRRESVRSARLAAGCPAPLRPKQEPYSFCRKWRWGEMRWNHIHSADEDEMRWDEMRSYSFCQRWGWEEMRWDETIFILPMKMRWEEMRWDGTIFILPMKMKWDEMR